MPAPLGSRSVPLDLLHRAPGGPGKRRALFPTKKISGRLIVPMPKRHTG